MARPVDQDPLQTVPHPVLAVAGLVEVDFKGPLIQRMRQMELEVLGLRALRPALGRPGLLGGHLPQRRFDVRREGHRPVHLEPGLGGDLIHRVLIGGVGHRQGDLLAKPLDRQHAVLPQERLGEEPDDLIVDDVPADKDVGIHELVAQRPRDVILGGGPLLHQDLPQPLAGLGLGCDGFIEILGCDQRGREQDLAQFSGPSRCRHSTPPRTQEEPDILGQTCVTVIASTWQRGRRLDRPRPVYCPLRCAIGHSI